MNTPRTISSSAWRDQSSASLLLRLVKIVPFTRHLFAFDENMEHISEMMPNTDRHRQRILALVRQKGLLLVKIKVYNVEKTIVDCFRHRNKIGLDVALEALKEAKSSKKFDMNALWHFAKLCRVANLMRPYLEAME